MIVGVLIGLCFELWSVYWMLREDDFMGLMWSLLAAIIVRFVCYVNNYRTSFWYILITFIIIPILAFIVKTQLNKRATQQKNKIRKSIRSSSKQNGLEIKKLIDFRSLFEPKEMIGKSDLSNRIKPVFYNAFAICREFGFEENGYSNYHYKNKIIDIYHVRESGSESDAFSPGKQVVVNFKGKRVFDCTIRMNGSIKLTTFENGDWKNYFKGLKNKIQKNIDARSLCLEVYNLMMNRTEVSKLSTVKRDSYAKPPEYNKLYNKYTYTFTDNMIEIVFFTTDNDIIGSSVKIKYNDEEVFDATHYRSKYCTKSTPYSTNTRCNQYKRGPWEEYFKRLLKKYCSSS